MSRGGTLAPENGVVKFKWRPASMLRSLAIAAARSESSMNIIALTEETVPCRMQSKVRSVFSRSLPQSSAFTMSKPEHGVSLLCSDEL
jgi:hypothetical protein